MHPANYPKRCSIYDCISPPRDKSILSPVWVGRLHSGCPGAESRPGKGAYVLQQSCERLLNAMTPLHPLQHPVPSQEDQVGFVLFPLLSAQNFNDLHEARTLTYTHIHG